MFLEYIALEILLIAIFGLSCFYGYKGILLSGTIATIINYFDNYPQTFLFWEIIIISYCLLGVLSDYYFNQKTAHLRVLKVSAGSVASLMVSGVFLPLIPGFIAWAFTIGLPLLFTYKEVPRAVYLQIIFKFIFSAGWIIIGNILY